MEQDSQKGKDTLLEGTLLQNSAVTRSQIKLIHRNARARARAHTHTHTHEDTHEEEADEHEHKLKRGSRRKERTASQHRLAEAHESIPT